MKASQIPARTIYDAVRIVLALLYTRFAWAYDAVAWLVSFGRWGEWQQVGMRALPAGPVLELGHGPGHLLRQRLLAGQPSIGLDRSPQMGRMALRRLRKAQLAARLVRAEAQALPFAVESFDGLLAAFPTEYILDRRTLAEARRVLRPGGALVVVAGVHITPHTLPERLLERLYRFTGETPPSPDTWTLPGDVDGLQLQVETVEAPGALVYRLTATKH
jgi:ubiquinone/menaquinone biosynthesis C-methylase UbiE